jgi:predicted RNA-binding Zn-ribbon protein involved in translation (DUF1610 family)
MKNKRPVCNACNTEMKPSRIDYFWWDIQYQCPQCKETVWRHNDGRRSEGFPLLIDDVCEAMNAMNQRDEKSTAGHRRLCQERSPKMKAIGGHYV